MKFKFIFSIIILGLLSIAANKTSEPGSVTVQERFNQRLLVMKSDVKDLLRYAMKADKSNAAQENLKSLYLKLRKSYKVWEYIADCTEPDFVKEQMNGAPLPKLEQNSFGLNILQPRGMQVVDELIYDDSILFKLDELVTELKKMDASLEYYQNNKIYDADVFISSRIALIRLFAISASGFDVPGSLASLEDMKHVTTAMYEDLLVYKPQLDSKDKQLSDSMYLLLEQQMNYLKEQGDFESFDRFEYLRTYINPLFSMLLSAHVKLEIELPSEIKVRKMAVNYMSRDIFSIQLLDINYFLDIPIQFRHSKSEHLGKLLFFDPILSSNNQRACASCHNPLMAFTDGKAKSEAFDHQGQIRRNSPTLWNSVLSEKYFHDLRAKDLSDQIEHVVVSTGEFNTSWNEIISKLNGSSQYRALFAEAFGTDEKDDISVIYIRYAIAAYVASLKGFNSRFDQLVHLTNNELEKDDKKIVRGFNLFMGKAACATCHFIPVFNGTVPPWYTDSESEVLGVPEKDMTQNAKVDPDLGRGSAMLKEQVDFYMHSFKTPTLRNIALTAPYMHNGVHKDLQAVMNFYNKGGGAGIGIHLEHQTLSSEPLNLTKKEISDIIAFLNALSDQNLPTDIPVALPKIESHPEMDNRVIGGVY